MIRPEINKIAKNAAEIVLLAAFADQRKFPVDKWEYELTPDNIESIKRIEDSELAKEVLGDLNHLQKLIQAAMKRKLDYLLAEGFTYKKKGYYVFYTEKEIESQIKRILNNDKDSI